MKRIRLSLIIISLTLAGCTVQPADTNQLQVVATFYPLAYVAEQVGGDLVTVTTLVPNGVEPHDYIATPQDIVKLTEADVLIYNGAGLDDWTADVAKSQLVSATPVTATDPHVWLDPIRLQDIAQTVAQAYTTVDPDNTAVYQANADALVTKLRALDNQFQSTLANCEIRQAIVSHDAFNYLAERYAIELLPMAGLNPNDLPSAQTIVELSEVARTYGIQYIFFEELTSPKLSETLAAEVGAATLVLSPIEGLTEEEQAAGDDYLSIMQRNLDNLALALRCQ